MPSLLHLNASILCPHGAPATMIPSQARVTIAGQPAATMADQFLVTGCAFAPGGVATPCVRIQWTVPAARVKVNGLPVLLQSSLGLGINAAQAPQGPAVVVSANPKVQGL